VSFREHRVGRFVAGRDSGLLQCAVGNRGERVVVLRPQRSVLRWEELVQDLERGRRNGSFLGGARLDPAVDQIRPVVSVDRVDRPVDGALDHRHEHTGGRRRRCDRRLRKHSRLRNRVPFRHLVGLCHCRSSKRECEHEDPQSKAFRRDSPSRFSPEQIVPA
jgi:hypothetical protein